MGKYFKTGIALCYQIQCFNYVIFLILPYSSVNTVCAWRMFVTIKNVCPILPVWQILRIRICFLWYVTPWPGAIKALRGQSPSIIKLCLLDVCPVLPVAQMCGFFNAYWFTWYHDLCFILIAEDFRGIMVIHQLWSIFHLLLWCLPIDLVEPCTVYGPFSVKRRWFKHFVTKKQSKNWIYSNFKYT